MVDVISPAELGALRAASVTPGTLASLYEVGAILGKGGFSTVRSGVDKATGNTVALK